jgi:hypothetical protein
LQQAKTWYQQVYPQNKSSLNTQSIGELYNGDLSQTFKPDWTKAEQYDRLGKHVIELPLDDAAMLGITSKTPAADGTIAYIAAKNNTISRFLVFSNDKGYQACIMTIVADSVWLNNDYANLNY